MFQGNHVDNAYQHLGPLIKYLLLDEYNLKKKTISYCLNLREDVVDEF